MPNGRTHKRVGEAAGALTAFVMADGQPMADRLIETFGGALGGHFGGSLPDLIDPATSPNHRSLGHGVVPVAAGVRCTVPNVGEWQNGLREQARFHAANRENAQTDFDTFFHGVAEIVFRLGAGAIPGLIAGYVSHVALDAGTPKGLPIIA